MLSSRRRFLANLAGASLLLPFGGRLFAARPQTAFTATQLEPALVAMLGGQTPIDQGVLLTAPSIAENGAQVRVEVKTELENVETISLLVEKNPVPLTSQFVFSSKSKPSVSVNLKVRETSQIIALVKADGKFYRASREVRVTAGGCG